MLAYFELRARERIPDQDEGYVDKRMNEIEREVGNWPNRPNKWSLLGFIIFAVGLALEVLGVVGEVVTIISFTGLFLSFYSLSRDRQDYIIRQNKAMVEEDARQPIFCRKSVTPYKRTNYW